MAEQFATFEEVDAYISKLDLSAFEEGGTEALAASAAPADVLATICKVYEGIKPILIIVGRLPLPTTWKAPLKVFMRIMDGVCPSD